MLYLDVTELYLFSRTAREVTGIQRVVLEIAHELTRAGRARCIVSHPHTRDFRIVRDDAFAGMALYDAARQRRLLGVPPRVRNLEKYSHSGFKRALMTARASLAALLPVRFGDAVEGQADLRGATILYCGVFTNLAWALKRARALAPDARVAALIHDAIPMLDGFGFGERDRAAFRAALTAATQTRARLLATSRNTARDLETLVSSGALPDCGAPAVVTPLAHEFRSPPAPLAASPEAAGRGTYLLTVGDLAGIKNIACLLEALAILRASGASAPRLVCAGRLSRAGRALVAPGGRFADLADLVTLVDQPDHATLHALYLRSAGLVFPSLYEGWGLPVGEAIWLDRPVLSSNAASLPEVGGDRALYFDPRDPAELAALLRRFFSDAGLQAEMARRRAAPGLRTWARVAADMADAAEA